MHVKDWPRFQHYKDRNPPWVKLHKSLLDDPDYHELTPEAAKVLPLLWLAASEYSTDGSLPNIKKLSFRLHYACTVLAGLIKQLDHWIIVDDSNLLAPCKQVATPETETETKTETKTEPRACALDTDFDSFWKSYPKKIGKKAALRAFTTARKSGCPDIVTLVLAIEKQAKSDQWRRDGGKFIPNPATWLNQGRWDDEVSIGDPALAGIMEWLNSEEDDEQGADRGMSGVDDEKLSRAVPVGHGNLSDMGKADVGS